MLGYRLLDESKQARAELGVAPQLDNLDVTLTVEQNLLVFTHLYRIGRSSGRRRSSGRSISRSCAIAATRGSTSSRAGWGGGC